jgi:hypothetical protein
MAAATLAVFVVLLLGVDVLTGGGLMGQMLDGSFAARTRADYSATVDQRLKPLRPSNVTAGANGRG